MKSCFEHYRSISSIWTTWDNPGLFDDVWLAKVKVNKRIPTEIVPQELSFSSHLVQTQSQIYFLNNLLAFLSVSLDWLVSITLAK